MNNMKLKLTLKPIRKTYDAYNEDDVGSSVSTEDRLIDHEFTKETNSILSLKIMLSEKLDCSCDSIDLWYKPSEYAHIIELKDTDCISSLSFTNSLYQTVLYYRCLSYPITILIDTNQKGMNRIELKVSITCSIIMIKSILEQQLIKGAYIDRSYQKLFGVSIATESSSIQKNINSDKELDNHIKILDILKEYQKSSQQGEYISEDVILILFLIVDDKAKSKTELRDDDLKHIKEVEEDLESEYSFGLNLIYLCNNYQCQKGNRRFIRRIGYGKCNIIRETITTVCLKCQSGLFVELENVGIVNGKWAFKGVLNIQKPFSFEGQGTTKSQNKLNLIPDLRLSKNYSQLIIHVIPATGNSKGSLLSKNETLASFSDSINKILSKTQSFNEMEQFKERANNKGETARKQKEKSLFHQCDSNKMQITILNNTVESENCGNGCCLLKGYHLSCIIF